MYGVVATLVGVVVSMFGSSGLIITYHQLVPKPWSRASLLMVLPSSEPLPTAAPAKDRPSNEHEPQMW